MNSTTKIIAGVAVLALLFAAVGYAAYSGTAKTYNEGNEVTADYVTLSIDSWAPLAGEKDIDFDSFKFNAGDAESLNVKTIYKPVDGTEIDTTTFQGQSAVLIGTKTLEVTNYTSGVIQSYKLTIKSSADIGGDVFQYYVQVNDGTPIAFATSLEFNFTTEDTLDVKLYLVYTPTYDVTSEFGPAVAGNTWVEAQPADIDEVKFTDLNFAFAVSNFIVTDA